MFSYFVLQKHGTNIDRIDSYHEQIAKESAASDKERERFYSQDLVWLLSINIEILAAYDVYG